MGIISVFICGLAAYLLNSTENEIIFNIAAVNTGINFWSYGVMHNFSDDQMSAPNSWTMINMVTTVIGVGLLVSSFFI